MSCDASWRAWQHLLHTRRLRGACKLSFLFACKSSLLSCVHASRGFSLHTHLLSVRSSVSIDGLIHGSRYCNHSVHFLSPPLYPLTLHTSPRLQPDASSEVYSGPIEMTEIGNQTIRAVALGPHVLASGMHSIKFPFALS